MRPTSSRLPALMLEEVHVPSTRGMEELQRGDTTLSPAQIECLLRLDGLQSLADVRDGMAQLDDEQFGAVFRSLRDRGLCEPRKVDVLAVRMQEQLAQFQALGDGRRAERHARSLQATGFSVGIARPRARAPQRVPGRELTAVVVEDEPVLARFIKSYLAFEGIRARLAANRAEVVAELRKLPVPDLVLLDVKLPDADGFDVLRKLRQHPVFREVPVIMLTGTATREAVIRGISEGADGYITKPFQAEGLLQAVRTVLGLAGDAQAPGPDPWVNQDAMRPRDELRLAPLN